MESFLSQFSQFWRSVEERFEKERLAFKQEQDEQNKKHQIQILQYQTQNLRNQKILEEWKQEHQIQILQNQTQNLQNQKILEELKQEHQKVLKEYAQELDHKRWGMLAGLRRSVDKQVSPRILRKDSLC